MADAAPSRARVEPALEESSADADRREHEASVQRLRRVLGVGVLLWNVIGIPNDFLVTETFGLSYREFLVGRVLSTVLVMGGWAVFFFHPGPRLFRVAEAVAFFGASAGLAALQHGLRGPTPIFLSCALLAQGIAVPRPWREGAVSLGVTWLGYPLGTLLLAQLSDRTDAEWSTSTHVVAFATHLFFAAATAAFAVIGGDAFYALRRQAREAQRVGSYRLRERLGAGTSGEVWRAHHPGLDQAVAVKIARDERTGRRVLAEAELLAGIAHPNVVRLLDRGRTDAGLPFYTMELVAGETLEALVARDGPLDLHRALALGHDVARALAALHAAGIVHRDVKPANVMVSARGREQVSTLIDFGLAARDGQTDARVVGSPRFMAPEQRSGAVSASADVFSCAALVVYALSGRSPLDTAAEPSLDAIGPALAALDVSEPTRAILREALAVRVEERPTSASLRDAWS